MSAATMANALVSLTQYMPLALGELSMLSLTYVSLPTPWQKNRGEILEDIRAVSLARNSQLDITGLLIATISHFAQVLEGPDGAVDDVLASISADPRHCQIVMVQRIPIEIRQFPLWQLMTFERETFANLEVTPLLAALHTDGGGEALARFIHLIDAISRSQTHG